MKKRLKERLKVLTGLSGVSGSEHDVVRYLRDNFEPVADEVKIDGWGNLIAAKKGSEPGPKVMIVVHSDEIGMVVKSISNDGYISFDRVGGVSDILLSGRKVLIKGRIPGILGIKAGHLQTPEEKKKAKSIRECYIDVGAYSKEEVENMGIKIGDTIVFQSDFMEMTNRDLISTKSVDNRIGCSVLLELFNELEGSDFAGTLYGVASVQEELGMRGAFMVGNQLSPDYAIVLDTIPCGDTPDINTDKHLPVRLGKGPACPLMDGIGGMPVANVVHHKIREIIEEQSKKVEVNIQYVTLCGDGYTTDAANVSLIGIPSGLLAVPRRYSHSPVELVNINDAEGLLKILKGIVSNNGKKEISFI